MTDGASEQEEVLSGTIDTGERWVVLASGDEENFLTILHVFRGDDHVAGSGFGGPKLPPGSVLNEWRGRSDGLPYFVMARMSPVVDRVVATTDRGTDVVLALTQPFEHFGLRFAVAALPEGERPASLRAEQGGVTLETRQQTMPPPPLPHR